MACLAIHVSITWDGMILFWSMKYLGKLPEVIQKPMFLCATCMCSFWTIAFWFIHQKPFSLDLLMTILVVGGLNTCWSLLLTLVDMVAENQ